MKHLRWLDHCPICNQSVNAAYAVNRATPKATWERVVCHVGQYIHIRFDDARGDVVALLKVPPRYIQPMRERTVKGRKQGQNSLWM